MNHTFFAFRVPATVIRTVATKKPMQTYISEFFLANRLHLMTPDEGLDFFIFFELVMPGRFP
jgi:hypothetical protein